MDGCDPQRPGELHWTLSAMVLLAASPPADWAGTDNYLAQAQSWIRQDRAANTRFLPGQQVEWKLFSQFISE